MSGALYLGGVMTGFLQLYMKHISVIYNFYLIGQNVFQNLFLQIENLLCLTVERQIEFL